MKKFFPDKEPGDLARRLIFPLIFAAVVFFILIAQLWNLQVMGASRYRELSLNNRVRLTKSTAPRGLIFDRNGVRLAENRPGFDLLVVPEDISDWDGTVSKLTQMVDITPELIEERLNKARKRPPFEAIKIKGDISWEEMARIESAKFRLPGVALSVGPKRSYPIGEATAHIVGYLGEIGEKELKESEEPGSIPYRLGDMVGRHGIERVLEEKIRGKDGGRYVEVDAVGREIKVIKHFPPTPGSNIYLTIDLGVQLAAARALEGKAGAIVAMDPKTGEILAMVSSPSFDPNLITAGMTTKEWKTLVDNPMGVLTNRSIQGQYPPASLLKPITATAVLEEGVITPYKKIKSGGSFTFGKERYRDWKKEGHGEINISRAIVESSDTFFYQVSLDLGIDKLAYYARGFGLGRETGIRLGNEKKGLIPDRMWKLKTYKTPWYRGETINASVGQGFMLATPIQLANAYAAIANGGSILKPKLIREVRRQDGKVTETFSVENLSKLPLAPSTLKLIRKALRGVVQDKGGTARGLMNKDFIVAGKTGTAQVVRMKERIKDIEEVKYKFRDHAWFVGFAPYEDPSIVVAVIVEHGGFGSRTAAPIALKIFRNYLIRVKPDSTSKPATPTVKKSGEV